MSATVSIFGRFTRGVADLGNPFYAEERQRDVWNEASAVGFQAMLWVGSGLACAMAWLGGPAVRPWSVALVGALGLASWLALGHARALGVEGTEGARVFRPRLFVYLGLLFVTVAGWLLPGPVGGSAFALGFAYGAPFGALGGLVVLGLAVRRRRLAEQEGVEGGEQPGA